MHQALQEIKRIGLVVITTACIYLVLARLNDWLFFSLISTFGNSLKASWLYLPSGLRFVFVLIFGQWGAVGVGLGTFLVLMPHGFQGEILSAVVLAFISGFAPWVAMYISKRKFQLDESLRNVDALTLIKMSLIFSVISPVMHQIWFVAHHGNTDIVQSTITMMAGDWFGTIALLYVGKLLLTLVDMRSTARDTQL